MQNKFGKFSVWNKLTGMLQSCKGKLIGYFCQDGFTCFILNIRETLNGEPSCELFSKACESPNPLFGLFHCYLDILYLKVSFGTKIKGIQDND